MIYIIIAYSITLFILIILAAKYYHSRKAGESFQQLMGHINIGYYKYRARDGVVLAANEGFVNILELDMTRREVIGRSLSELLVYVEEEESIRKLVRQRGRIKNREYHFKTLKGKDKWVLHNAYLIKDPYLREDIVEVIIEDITEERLSYEKMRESQQRYKKLFKNSGDMVIAYRFDDNIIEEVNPVTEVVTGYSVEEFSGRSFDELFHPSYRKGLKEGHNDLLFKGSTRLESVIVCKNGTYRDVIMTLSIVELEEHNIVIAVIKDVSELVKGREEQDRRKKELEDFWKASVAREERIKDLREELERAKHQIKLLKEKK